MMTSFMIGFIFTRRAMELSVNRLLNACCENPPESDNPEKLVRLMMKNRTALSKSSLHCQSRMSRLSSAPSTYLAFVSLIASINRFGSSLRLFHKQYKSWFKSLILNVASLAARCLTATNTDPPPTNGSLYSLNGGINGTIWGIALDFPPGYRSGLLTSPLNRAYFISIMYFGLFHDVLSF